MSSRFIDAEKILALAEDVFFELAAENLSAGVLKLVADNSEKLFVEIQENLSDWDSFLPGTIDQNHFLEVNVFLEFNESESIGLASLLMPVEFQEAQADEDTGQDIHVQWL